MFSINTTQYIVLYRFDWCVYNNMDSDHLMCQPSYPDRLNSRQKEEDWKKKNPSFLLSSFTVWNTIAETKSFITDHFLYFVTSFPVSIYVPLASAFYVSAAFCFFSELLRSVVVERQFTCNDVCGELWLVRVLLTRMCICCAKKTRWRVCKIFNPYTKGSYDIISIYTICASTSL